MPAWAQPLQTRYRLVSVWHVEGGDGGRIHRGTFFSLRKTSVTALLGELRSTRPDTPEMPSASRSASGPGEEATCKRLEAKSLPFDVTV